MSDKRLALLEQMTSSGQADAFAWYGLAMEYRSRQRWDDAMKTFEALHEKDPTYVPQYLMCGQMLAERGERMPIELACVIAHEVARGLHYAHTRTGPGGAPCPRATTRAASAPCSRA